MPVPARIAGRFPALVIWIVFGLGASIWYLPFSAAAGLALLLAVLVARLGRLKFARLGFARLMQAYLAFTLLWAGGRIGFAVYNGLGLAGGLWLGLDLALRIMVIAGAGVSLLFLLTPCQVAREAGLSLKWLLPAHYWKLSLALLIMLSFFEAALVSWRGLSQTLKLRAGACPLRIRLGLAGGALLRLLSRQTWERTLCVAARRLDRPEAWSRG